MGFDAVILNELGAFLIHPYWGQPWALPPFCCAGNALVAQVGIGGELNTFWGWKQGKLFFVRYLDI